MPWAPKGVIWKDKKELRVKIIENIPSHWTYCGRGINTSDIFSWANEWNSLCSNIPSFTLVQDDPSDIRILYNSESM